MQSSTQQTHGKLFFVSATNAEDGANLDLMVVALDAEQAKKFWREYYAESVEDDAEPNWATEVPGITAQRPVGAIPWQTLSGW